MTLVITTVDPETEIKDNQTAGDEQTDEGSGSLIILQIDNASGDRKQTDDHYDVGVHRNKAAGMLVMIKKTFNQ